MTRWWTRPRMLPGEEEMGERKVGFLDLFYDLIFVVAIAQVAHGLAHHMDAKGAIAFTMLFLPIFWTWIGQLYYNDRFENRDVSHVFVTFLQMVPVVGMAVFAHDGRGETAAGFIASYVVGRILLAGLWFRGGVHDARARNVAWKLAGGFILGALPWIASIFVEDPLRLQLQVFGLLLDLAVPSIIGRSIAKLPPFAESRLQERFGLITIIVLGESIAGTVNGLSGVHHLTLDDAITAIVAFGFAFALYWTYFEMVPRENLRPGIWPTFARSYVHFPLMLAITATGAGVLASVGHAHEALSEGTRVILGSAIALGYVCMIGLSRIHVFLARGANPRFRTEAALVLSATLCMVMVVFGDHWTGQNVVVALFVVAMIPPLAGIVGWWRATRHWDHHREA